MNPPYLLRKQPQPPTPFIGASPKPQACDTSNVTACPDNQRQLTAMLLSLPAPIAYLIWQFIKQLPVLSLYKYILIDSGLGFMRQYGILQTLRPA